MLIILTMLALAGAPDVQAQEQTVYEATFRPLKKAERSYANLGPAGPYYPEYAANARANGLGLLRCRVAADGELAGCKSISETPRRSGFSIAARIMADRKRIFVADAPRVGETILVRVPFVLGAPANVER